ncbi:hypothetical protein [Nocardia arthritidis]|uniref:Uncharacterized protein n=1 Tax=Nocardia arthritidis TaxID=228602 RepID=A0A6G9Y6T7_9NOCA|nr:hypothetical protein [Nocardia arthritidis]QIS08820.1 hypothetical protein F5544_04530 [Nocardia arthritidis]
MSVHVKNAALMTSDITRHQARCTGDGGWVVSFLPGRTLSTDQALAALRAAEELAAIQAYAAPLGLTALELVGMAANERPWHPTPADGRGWHDRLFRRGQ